MLILLNILQTGAAGQASAGLPPAGGGPAGHLRGQGPGHRGQKCESGIGDWTVRVR